MRGPRAAGLATLGVVALVAVTAPPALAKGGGGGGGAEVVQVRDECDPVTFNAPPEQGGLGPGACDPQHGGQVTLAQLGTELATRPGHVLEHRDALGWRFNPDDTHLHHGESIVAQSRGGEVHSFTEVAAFGGGCVPDLNAPFGLQPVAECGTGPAPSPQFLSTLLFPGGQLNVPATQLGKGTHFFECLIHPWMRTTVEVR